jgi:hypothetical protein
MVYLYESAFKFLKMGYTTAMAWVLFVIILMLTLVNFKSSSAWVYYENEAESAQAEVKGVVAMASYAISRKQRRIRRNIVLYVLLTNISLSTVFPLLWLVSKSGDVIFELLPRLLPDGLHWENYSRAVTEINFRMVLLSFVAWLFSPADCPDWAASLFTGLSHCGDVPRQLILFVNPYLYKLN